MLSSPVSHRHGQDADKFHHGLPAEEAKCQSGRAQSKKIRAIQFERRGRLAQLTHQKRLYPFYELEPFRVAFEIGRPDIPVEGLTLQPDDLSLKVGNEDL